MSNDLLTQETSILGFNKPTVVPPTPAFEPLNYAGLAKQYGISNFTGTPAQIAAINSYHSGGYTGKTKPNTISGGASINQIFNLKKATTAATETLTKNAPIVPSTPPAPTVTKSIVDPNTGITTQTMSDGTTTTLPPSASVAYIYTDAQKQIDDIKSQSSQDTQTAKNNLSVTQTQVNNAIQAASALYDQNNPHADPTEKAQYMASLTAKYAPQLQAAEQAVSQIGLTTQNQIDSVLANRDASIASFNSTEKTQAIDSLYKALANTGSTDLSKISDPTDPRVASMVQDAIKGGFADNPADALTFVQSQNKSYVATQKIQATEALAYSKLSIAQANSASTIDTRQNSEIISDIKAMTDGNPSLLAFQTPEELANTANQLSLSLQIPPSRVLAFMSSIQLPKEQTKIVQTVMDKLLGMSGTSTSTSIAPSGQSGTQTTTDVSASGGLDLSGGVTVKNTTITDSAGNSISFPTTDQMNQYLSDNGLSQ